MSHNKETISDIAAVITILLQSNALLSKQIKELTQNVPQSAAAHSTLEQYQTEYSAVETAVAAMRLFSQPAIVLSEHELRGMNDERVFVIFPDFSLHCLVAFHKETSDDYGPTDGEVVYLTNSMGGRNSYAEVIENDGIVYSRDPSETTLSTPSATLRDCRNCINLYKQLKDAAFNAAEVAALAIAKNGKLHSEISPAMPKEKSVCTNGHGCISCPAHKSCRTGQYRGSDCSAERAKAGVNLDPKTNFECLQARTEETVAAQRIYPQFVNGKMIWRSPDNENAEFLSYEEAETAELAWLRQPANVELHARA